MFRIDHHSAAAGSVVKKATHSWIVHPTLTTSSSPWEREAAATLSTKKRSFYAARWAALIAAATTPAMRVVFPARYVGFTDGSAAFFEISHDNCPCPLASGGNLLLQFRVLLQARRSLSFPVLLLGKGHVVMSRGCLMRRSC